MHIIDLTPLEEGVYNDHNSDNITEPPEGWAIIPDGFPLPSTFPRLGNLVAEEKTYPFERKRTVPVTKTRAVPVYDEDGELTTMEEEFQDEEEVTEVVEYHWMTVTEMTEGTPAPEVTPVATKMDEIEAQTIYTAMMTDTLLATETAVTLDLHGPWYDKVLLWYQQGLWTTAMLLEAVEKNLIVQDEADEIINGK